MSPSNPIFLKYGQQNASHLAISKEKRSSVKTVLALGANKGHEIRSSKTGLRQTTLGGLALFLGRDDFAELL